MQWVFYTIKSRLGSTALARDPLAKRGKDMTGAADRLRQIEK
jgi:hypothetical protein